MKVVFLTNLPSPYRVDFFNELGKNGDSGAGEGIDGERCKCVKIIRLA